MEDTEDELEAFVEELGDYLETSGMARGVGRMLAWLLVCEPEHQSAEQLATALQVSAGGVSTNARLLMMTGFIERQRFPGDRRTYYRVKPHAFDASLGDGAQRMGQLRRISESGLAAVGESTERAERLRQLQHLAAFMETELVSLDERYLRTREETS